MSQEETETTAAEEKTQFRFRYVLVAILLLLFILSIASHNPADLAVLEGGSSEPVRNLIGPLGAKIARVLFYLFGLAIYPIAAFLMICLVRSFIPVPAKRKGYIRTRNGGDRHDADHGDVPARHERMDRKARSRASGNAGTRALRRRDRRPVRRTRI